MEYFKDKANQYYIAVVLLIGSIYVYSCGSIYGFSLVPDEFGYWSYGATILGYDWHEVASIGSYYSFGYSLILTPILFLFKDGIIAYRVAVGVNFILLIISGLIIRKIIKRLCPDITPALEIIFTVITILYPAWVTYAHMTMVEALLSFLFILVTYLMLKFIDNPSLRNGLYLVVTLIYMYSVHMRTVAIVIAAGAVILIRIIQDLKTSENKKRKIIKSLIICLFLFVLLFAVHILKKYAQEYVFSSANKKLLSINDYSGQAWRLSFFIKPEEWPLLFIEAVGKLYYLSVASCGLLVAAIIWCVNKTDLFKIFILLSIIGQLMLCSMYLHGGYLTDNLIYGRYNEHLIPIAIVLGMIQLYQTYREIRTSSIVMFFIVAFSVVTSWAIGYYDYSHIRGYHVLGVNYFLNQMNKESIYILGEAGIGLFLFIILMLTVSIVKRKKGMEFLFSYIIALELMGIVITSQRYVYTPNRTNYYDLKLVDAINDNYIDGDSIGLIAYEWPEYIDFIQMQLRDKSVSIIENGKDLKVDDLEYRFLLVPNELADVMDAQKNKVIGSTFSLYY